MLNKLDTSEESSDAESGGIAVVGTTSKNIIDTSDSENIIDEKPTTTRSSIARSSFSMFLPSFNKLILSHTDEDIHQSSFNFKEENELKRMSKSDDLYDGGETSMIEFFSSYSGLSIFKTDQSDNEDKVEDENKEISSKKVTKNRNSFNFLIPSIDASPRCCTCKCPHRLKKFEIFYLVMLLLIISILIWPIIHVLNHSSQEYSISLKKTVDDKLIVSQFVGSWCGSDEESASLCQARCIDDLDCSKEGEKCIKNVSVCTDDNEP